MNKLTLVILVGALSMMLGACSDSLDPDDGDDPIVTENFTSVDNGDGSFTTTANAGSMSDTEYVYFRFQGAAEAEPVDPSDSAAYDLAFLFANINLNGGINGTGGVELIYFDDSDFDVLTEAPADGYITDLSNDDTGRAFNQGATGEQNGGWYHYTGPPDHQMVVVVDRYYLIHSVDGVYYKLHITSFATGGPSTPSELVFDWQEISAP